MNKPGIELIAEERQRQIEKEGWTPEHDDQHSNGSLAIAAACYALPEHVSPIGKSVAHITGVWCTVKRWDFWPWEPKWWKPSPYNRIRELTKAGALIAAENDRIQRVNKEG